MSDADADVDVDVDAGVSNINTHLTQSFAFCLPLSLTPGKATRHMFQIYLNAQRKSQVLQAHVLTSVGHLHLDTEAHRGTQRRAHTC